MPVVIAAPLAVSDEQRAALERMARSTSLPHRKVVQAQGVAVGRGWRGDQRGDRPPVSGRRDDTVRAWRRRFDGEGVDGVGSDRPGSGPQVVAAGGHGGRGGAGHREETPDDTSTHWTTRSLAERFGIGKDTVARIWRDHDLKPWRVDTFKLSNDPRFEEKLVDVVGLVPEPAGAGGGVLLRREDPVPGAGPHPAQPADEAGPGRHDDPRLQAARHHRPVRGAERRHRRGALRLPQTPHRPPTCWRSSS